jgi:heme A synthase
MKRFRIDVAWLAIFVLTSLFIGSVVDTRIAELIGTSVTSRSLPPSRISDSRTQVPILAAFNQLPMSFEPNRGQTDEHVKFLSRTTGYTLFLTDSEAVLLLETQADKSRNL